MPALQLSLSDWEIAQLAKEANRQTKEIRDNLPERNWDQVPRIVAATVAAQMVRKALKEMATRNDNEPERYGD